MSSSVRSGRGTVTLMLTSRSRFAIFGFGAAVAVALIAVAGSARADAPSRLVWQPEWRRVGAWEYALTPTVSAATLGVYFLVPRPEEARWTGPILFDNRARQLLGAESRARRSSARNASDILFYGSVVQPVLIDPLLVTWAEAGAPDVAWQMLWINAEAYALTVALNTIVKRATARRRPFGDRCPDSSAEFPCDQPYERESFYSGHSAVTATSAGLVCAHHTHLSLYGTPAADLSGCGAAVVLALTAGVLRISGDQHWASDVVVGGVAGFASGYLLPTLLYYGSFSPPRPATAGGVAAVALLPIATESSIELSAVGVF